MARRSDSRGLFGIDGRPWLQAFRDYAFGGRAFAAGEIRAQIKAAEDSGADGWMLWNARNQYSTAGLQLEPVEVGVGVPETRRGRRITGQ